jgi:hypothetical protein
MILTDKIMEKKTITKKRSYQGQKETYKKDTISWEKRQLTKDR